MFRWIAIIVLTVFVAGLIQCQKTRVPGNTSGPLFDSIPTSVTITPIINEASGIADSKQNPGRLWVQEDSGNPTQLFLVNHNGSIQKKIFLQGTFNRDWEDMVLAGNDIYIGEIGDNNAIYPDYLFYKFPEPDALVDTVNNVQTIRFQYPDGSHDAEAFFVEPVTNVIYIITKRDNPSRIYKLTPPFSPTAMNTAQAVGLLTYNGVVSAAISPDASEIIIKTYVGLAYYKRAPGEQIEAALQRTAIRIPYEMEPQGEAVCFTTNNGYFTVSEKAFANDVKLYFYKRN